MEEEFDKPEIEKKKFSLAISISVAVMLMGMLLKIIHYPFAALTVLTGQCLISLFYILRFISRTDKNALSIIKLVFVLSYCITGALNILDWPYSAPLKIIYLFALVIWAVLEVFHYYKFGEFSFSMNVQKFPTLYIGAALVIVGAMFKIQHWPSSSVMLTCGFVLVAFSFVWDVLKGRKSKEEE